MKGAIVLVDSKGTSFISKCIKFFTGRVAKRNGVPSYTHAMFEVGDVCGVRSVLSAEELMAVMPLDKFRKDTKFRIYSVNDDVKLIYVKEVLKEMYQTAGNRYGFLQLLWFVYRWAVEIMGFDVRRNKNFFPKGDICSEQTYRYLMKRLENTESCNDLRIFLEQWNENTVHPVDIAIVVKKFPRVFKLEESYGFDD